MFSEKSRSTSPSNASTSPILADSSGSNTPNNRSYKLFDPKKLGIAKQHRAMFAKVNQAVIQFMYGPAFDASHDYEHIQRVVALAHKMYEAHKNDAWARDIDTTVLYIACMVHDIGDTKYHVRKKGDERDQQAIVCDFLKANSCNDLRIYAFAAKIAAHVSYSLELKDPNAIREAMVGCPALRIVQDADRLDGLGAIGIGRCFVFGGINEERRKNTIHTGIELHFERFQKYLELMKTGVGKELAEGRLGVMEGYRKNWFGETDCNGVL
ncbi:hypothetical protein CC86DRAFT_350715 [Ophiobolus disseminans]|uniref:HD/PDEase domain-containing protein n=1 Tax=Ophiobolus disseminans TaxID=1469910 RepID=A0A6A6ZYR0_9PLEO|nr:hypothetical protein CC86DRAFT_350715 [Ophiobolus disseminans]